MSQATDVDYEIARAGGVIAIIRTTTVTPISGRGRESSKAVSTTEEFRFPADEQRKFLKAVNDFIEDQLGELSDWRRGFRNPDGSYNTEAIKADRDRRYAERVAAREGQ